MYYSSDPMQAGPVYFLTQRMCAIFGICCEAILRQMNYLVDEAVEVGKPTPLNIRTWFVQCLTHCLGQLYLLFKLVHPLHCRPFLIDLHLLLLLLQRDFVDIVVNRATTDILADRSLKSVMLNQMIQLLKNNIFVTFKS